MPYDMVIGDLKLYIHTHVQILCIHVRYRYMYVRYIIICEWYKVEYSTLVKFNVFTLATFSVVPLGKAVQEMKGEKSGENVQYH